MVDTVICLKIAREHSISPNQVRATVELLDEGATVPFISRYRKEITGSLDEVQIQTIQNELGRLRELERRREFILDSIEGQGKLTDELKKKINEAEMLSTLEDLYLPYKPKRRTKATVAREKGLESLAVSIFEQNLTDINTEAAKYINSEKGVLTTDDALEGARDIIAEIISEDAIARETIRNLFLKTGIVKSSVIYRKEEEGEKFKDYFEWQEPLESCPSHRLLAMMRGQNELILALEISVDTDGAVEKLKKIFIKKQGECAGHIATAIEDGYERLLRPSIENEVWAIAKEKADEEAIKVFAENLRELLLASPLGQKSILALDPGFRSGCKVVVLNAQGKLLQDTVVYPHEPQKMVTEAEHVILALAAKYNVEAIAIGNGTASRETEQFIRNIEVLPKSIPVIVVNESGASIYSASAVAREEFPDHDVTVRGAVSIGRRLADPLAELVKIDPKSIGVGQYQHDVNQQALKRKLDEVVISCVNSVGVELNTASKELLSYVSGVSSAVAKNIVEYRNANGPFKSRKELLKVNKIGEKVFEQCSGFLRIIDGVHPLDKSAVHPESYMIVEKMAKDLKSRIDDLINDKELRKKINLNSYITEKVGLPTLKDIMNELEKPGRDPRQTFEAFSFDDSVHNMEDLREGMRLPGVITNVTNFGAFVDIGVHQDGLVHISQLCDEFVDDPNKVVKVGQKVWVNVVECDVQRKRIALSMKGENSKAGKKKQPQKSTEPQYDPNDMQSALAALKSKFGK